jgi:uncharacterized protein (DUF342 family)
MAMTKPESPAYGNPSAIISDNPNDARIDVIFMENDLEVRASFVPAQKNGSQLDEDYINTLLKKMNINYGIQWDNIKEAAQQCNTTRKIIKDIIIARGDPPKDEILEYVQLNPILAPAADQDKNGSIDYRSASPFIIVKKDQALAKQKSRKPGLAGKNVHGGSIPHGVQKPEGVSGGENTRMADRFLLSNISGQMVVEKGVVKVRDYLEIKGPVGYKTGNIIFPGNVTIDGPVSDGFKIYSGGSVTIKQTFDVTDATTKTDLNVAGGIIGRGRALVKVGGNINTKFIENCRAACRHTVTVQTDIVNSSIFALESVGIEKGRIVGSEIWAVKGVRAAGIGKASGKGSRVHCGIDFTVQQEKEKNNNMLRILSAKLNKLKTLMAQGDVSGERREKMEGLFKRLEAEQQKAAAAVSELIARINADENAVIEVSGEIAQGTLVEICQIALFVTEPLKKVRIRLDKENGKLITENF